MPVLRRCGRFSCGYRADSAHTFGQSNVAMFSAQESDLRSLPDCRSPPAQRHAEGDRSTSSSAGRRTVRGVHGTWHRRRSVSKPFGLHVPVQHGAGFHAGLQSVGGAGSRRGTAIRQACAAIAFSVALSEDSTTPTAFNPSSLSKQSWMRRSMVASPLRDGFKSLKFGSPATSGWMRCNKSSAFR